MASTIPTRRASIGAVAGIVPGILLATDVDPAVLGLLAGPVLGALYGLAFRITDGSELDHGLSATALSIPAWLAIRIVGSPLLQGRSPAWTPDAMRTLFPGLVTWLLAGTLFGVLLPLTSHVVESRYGRVTKDTSPPEVETRIVIVGGGFAGLTVAQRLESRFGPDPTVELSLVSKTNAILFTPMLAEVAAGSLEPTHITTPLRTSLRRTRVIQSEATGIDFEERTVRLGDEEPPASSHGGNSTASGESRVEASFGETLSYDHLVLALGSVPDYKGLEGVDGFAFDFKTLQDAMRLRNHVIDCFERAEREADPETRRALVTFFIAGAGFAGAELAGALNDFVRGILVYYSNVPPEDVEVVVVHSRDRIMPELSESLAAYALDRMRERGIEFRLDTYVEDADADLGIVSLSTGETVRTETLVWTAGNRPNPFVATLDVPKTETGAIEVDTSLSVPDRDGIWAAGDCAAVFDPITGNRYPSTAEHAIRAGTVLGDNVYAAVTGGQKRQFEYRSPGSLAVIGYQTACAELWNRRFSGLFAWILWRIVYLSKLPGTERKIRVFVNWLIEIAFPRDIVQTMDGERQYRVRRFDDGH